jgi:zinc protease
MTRAKQKAGGKAVKARPQLSRLKLPPIEEGATSTGMTVIAARRGPLPLVSLRLLIQAGSATDPAGKHGLADFTARLLRRGTASLSADAINEAVEFVGAAMAIGVAEDYAVVRITTPAEHVPAMLDVMGQVLGEPSFPEEEVTSARERTLAEMANDLDDPALLADRAIVRAIWGEHPYGHQLSGSAASVRGFTREDSVRFHRERMGPRVSMLVAVGDLDPQELFAAAERSFKGWSGGPLEPVRAPALEQPALKGAVVVVDKPEQTQSQVRIGTLAFGRSHPDYVPAHVVNTAFGGGFTSRLIDEIRVNRGLSYGASSAFDTMLAGGWLGISSFTKTATTREILDVAFAQASRLRAKGLNARELERTQTYVSGLYPLRTETNDSIAGGIGDARLYGLGDDWMARFRELVHDVSLEEANRVASRYFLGDGATIAVVGRASEVVDQLSGLGPVRVWPLSELE